MCCQVIEFLDNHDAELNTITELAKDDCRNDNSWCRCELFAYDYDKFMQNLCNQLRIKSFASVDALVKHNNWINLIEFKNSDCRNKDTRSKTKRKLADTIHFFEKCILDELVISQSNLKYRFILVFNPGDESIELNNGYESLNREINTLGGLDSPSKERLRGIVDYCNTLRLCHDIKILTVDEFLTSINEYVPCQE